MNRSFRAQLAIRFTATMVVGSAAVAAAGYWALRSVLNRQIDASLLSVASIQAGSVTSDPAGGMASHEWDLTPAEATSLRDLARYAQVWSESGESLLRSRYMTSDIPLDRELLLRAAGPVWREEMAENPLTLARSDAGVIQPRMRRVDLRARAARAAEVVQRLEPRAGDLAVRIDLVGEDPVPVLGDATLLGRLTWNLADNALKFVPPGSRVELTLGASDEEARLTVSDEGPGIPDDDLDRVFERFYRAPGAAQSEGSGLGLAIVQAIAIAHGGEVSARNRVAGGAVFSIRIPRNGFGDA